ncbi:MAG: hypothetical protein QME40_02275 [bacterium]|nr:hypothetical protein [bacterium]
MNKKCKGFLLSIPYLLLAIISFGASFFPPGLKWQVLETDHFIIHFHDGEEEIAKELSRIAEEVAEEIVPFLRHKPKGKTQIVLSDNTDYCYGFAMAFPNNAIYISPTPPSPEFLSIRYGDWLRLVISHEYTHVLHMDTISGFPHYLRSIFGRIIIPNAIQPIWLLEGLAVYNESKMDTGGRLSDPFYDMILRQAVLEDRINSLDQIRGYHLKSWPSRTTPYVYGGSLFKYMAEKYGEERFSEINYGYSRYFFTISPESWAIRTATGIGSETLYHEWIKWVKERYHKQLMEIKKVGITISKRLTYRGFIAANPTFSPDGRYIAYMERNMDGQDCLRIMREDGKEDHKLVNGDFSHLSFSFSPDGEEVVFSQKVVEKGFSTYSDLYIFNLVSKKLKRLTYGKRAKDPSFSPDGKYIVFVTNELGSNRLMVMDTYSGDISPLTSDRPHVQYSNPSFSSDGKKIVYTCWEKGYQDIFVMDVESKDIIPITHDKAQDITPSWLPDSSGIIFSSDRTGVYNLYIYSLKGRKLYRITNVISGAFSPCVSKEGKVTFVSYSADGFDIHLMDLDKATWQEVPITHHPSPITQRPSPNTQYPIPNTLNYNPLPTLLPKFWFPALGLDEEGLQLGFLSGGKDVLYEHSYSINARYGLNSKRLVYNLRYTNDQFYPSFTIGVSSNIVPYLVNDKFYWEEEKERILDLSFPINSINSKQRFSIRYSVEKLKPITSPPKEYTRGELCGSTISWEFSNTRKFGSSISEVGGRHISISYSIMDKSLGSDFNINKYRFTWSEYIGLPFKHHVLAIRFAYGLVTGDTVFQRQFKIGEDTGFGLLRGYKSYRGSNIYLVNLEYRAPVCNIERGLDFLPLFFDRVHHTVFLDLALNVHVKVSTGLELRVDTHIFYHIPITLRAGIAYGFNEGGKKLLPIIGIGTSF